MGTTCCIPWCQVDISCHFTLYVCSLIDLPEALMLAITESIENTLAQIHACIGELKALEISMGNLYSKANGSFQRHSEKIGLTDITKASRDPVSIFGILETLAHVKNFFGELFDHVESVFAVSYSSKESGKYLNWKEPYLEEFSHVESELGLVTEVD
eukprot:m.179957 g.179957  ORF g.179957 m.179957 type:complete len:157 (-) comp15485_c0_seq12:1176-1646(-)